MPVGKTPRAALFAFVALHGGAFDLAVDVALFDVLALVVLLFALADGDGDFDLAVLPVEGEGDEGVALDGGLAEQLANFVLVQKQAASGLGLVILHVAEGVLIDVGIVQPDLIVLDAREGVTELPLAGAKRLHLSALEDDASLVGFEDMVVAAGFRITEDIGHAKTKQPEV